MNPRIKHKKSLLSDVLINSPTLRNLYEKVITLNQLNEMNQRILSKIAPTLAPHCRVANLRDQTLVLTTDSPIWLHALRYTINKATLLTALKAEFSRRSQSRPSSTLKDIRFQISLPFTFSEQGEAQGLERGASQIMRVISSQGAQSLSFAAQTVGSKKLSQALLKLLRHQRFR